ncbi:Serine/threonine-protein phosphatase 2 [compost metagenome]
MTHIKSFGKNLKGRDFFTSDLHGSFDLLHEQMRLNAFDTSKDRLFVGGDWCDRNSDSTNILDYIYEPYIHSVRGNHEEMLIQAYEDNLLGHAARMLYNNGGEWYWDCSPEKQKAIYEAFKSLPLAIEIESSEGLIGIVHAEVPYNDWEKFRGTTKAELEWSVQAIAQWARTKYDKQDNSDVKGVRVVLCGHSPTNSGEVEWLGNQVFADLGSFFRGKISFFELEY